MKTHVANISFRQTSDSVLFMCVCNFKTTNTAENILEHSVDSLVRQHENMAILEAL